MKSSFLQAGLAAFVSFCSLLCVAQPLTRADRPDVRVGDRWIFQTSDGRTGATRPGPHLTVREVSAENFVTETAKGQRWTYSRDWNLIEIKSGETVTFSAKPSWTFFQFPLEVGKQWESRSETTDPARTAQWQLKAHVEGVESVTVAAGTFQAFKIRFVGTFSVRQHLDPSFLGSRKQTVWYSPDCKCVVKNEWEDWTAFYYNIERAELKSVRLAQ
jgi:hypothetical protein